MAAPHTGTSLLTFPAHGIRSSLLAALMLSRWYIIFDVTAPHFNIPISVIMKVCWEDVRNRRPHFNVIKKKKRVIIYFSVNTRTGAQDGNSPLLQVTPQGSRQTPALLFHHVAFEVALFLLQDRRPRMGTGGCFYGSSQAVAPITCTCHLLGGTRFRGCS